MSNLFIDNLLAELTSIEMIDYSKVGSTYVGSNQLKVDWVNKYVVSSSSQLLMNGLKGNHKKTKHRIYKHRSPSANRKIKLLAYNAIQFMTNPRMITITTKQHETNKTDSEIYEVVTRWIKRKKYFGYFSEYICVVERQEKKTNDLHFHIILDMVKPFRFKHEIKWFAYYFGIKPHPSVFDVSKRLKKHLCAYYVAKLGNYIGKGGKVVDRCHVFTCRTYSCSRGVLNSLRNNIGKFITVVPDWYLYNHITDHLQVKKEMKYAAVYKYHDSLVDICNLDVSK